MRRGAWFACAALLASTALIGEAPATPPGPLGRAELFARAREHLARARTVARAARSASVGDARARAMAELYERPLACGAPEPVLVGGQPAAARIPLTGAEGTTGELYLHPVTGGVIEWPLAILERRPLSEVSDASGILLDALPPLLFEPAPPEATMDPVRLEAYQSGVFRKVIGIPVAPSDPRDVWLPHVGASSYAKSLRPDPTWIRRYNARHGTSWKVPGGARVVAARCWSYAFSYAVDWWNQELGRPLGAYRSLLTGRRERGFDPARLDRMYRELARTEPEAFPFIPTLAIEDPVTGEPVPGSMEAFARVVSRLPAMEGRFVQVFRDNRGTIGSIEEALRTFGVLIAGEVGRHRGATLRYSTHAVPIVGTTRIAGQPMAVFLEPSMGTREDAQRLRAYPVAMFREAYAFPHAAGVRAGRR